MYGNIKNYYLVWSDQLDAFSIQCAYNWNIDETYSIIICTIIGLGRTPDYKHINPRSDMDTQSLAPTIK